MYLATEIDTKFWSQISWQFFRVKQLTVSVVVELLNCCCRLLRSFLWITHLIYVYIILIVKKEMCVSCHLLVVSSESLGDRDVKWGSPLAWIKAVLYHNKASIQRLWSRRHLLKLVNLSVRGYHSSSYFQNCSCSASSREIWSDKRQAGKWWAIFFVSVVTRESSSLRSGKCSVFLTNNLFILMKYRDWRCCCSRRVHWC